MRWGRARGARVFAWTLAALVVLLLVVTVGLPAIVRGRVLAGLVAHASKDLCGSIKVDGGHVGIDVALALLRQRPFEVAVDGVAIRTPAGEDMFHARTVRAHVTVRRRPWRVEIDRGLVADGAWSLVDKGFGEPLAAALDRVPPGGRAQCGQPKPPEPEKPPRQGDLVVIRGMTLRDFTIVLSFGAWAVKLDSTDARGSLQVRGQGTQTQWLFDVRDLEAKRGGSLRVGPAGNRLTPEVPFDRVAIARVAVVDSAPQNLLLEVEAGRTGQAVLSGHAVFTDIFAPEGSQVPPGMKLDARWTAIGQALRRNPNWADVGSRLAGLNAGLEVSLHGPFKALIGSAALTGDGASLNARLLPRRRYELDVRFDKLDTEPLVPASQRDQLGGRLDGRIEVSAQLAPEAIDTSISVDRLEIDLRRHRQAGGPRRLVISRAAGVSSSDELRIGLGVIALHHGVLRVASLRARGPGVQLDSSLRAERPPGSGAFRIQATTQPASRLAFRGETFVLPRLVRARFEPGRALTVEPFSIDRVGGGAIDVRGSLRADGPADLRAAVRGYPLAHIPGLAGAQAPGQGAPIARVLRGQLDASFRLAGTTREPHLSGVLATTGVRWAGQRLGDGRIVFDGVAGGTRFEGPLIDGVGVRGQLHRHARRDDFVAVSLRDLRLGPWLPRTAAALGLRASGNVVLEAPGRPARTTATGDVSITGTGIALNVAARLRPEQGTASVHGRLDLGRLDLGWLRATFPALRLRSVAGVIAADVSWRAAAREGGGGLWPYARSPATMAGVHGTVAVSQPILIWSTRLPAITVPATRIELGGNEVRVPGVEVHTRDTHATVAGRIRDIDWSQPDGGVLEGKLTVAAEGRGLGRWLGGVTGAGSARFAGALSGSLRAPRVDGQANLDDLTVSWSRSPVGTVRVTGPVAIAGRKLAVGPLMVRFENGGWLKIAGPRGAGQLTVAPGRAPFRLDDVDLTLQGSGLGTTRPFAGLSVKDLALDLRLAKSGDDKLRVTGEVRLGHNVYDLKAQRKGATADDAKKPKARPAPHRADQPRAIDRVTLDVRLTGPADAVRVRVPNVPDVTVGLSCHVRGPLAAPHIAGEVRGSGAYSRAALTLADRFTDRNLRKCDLGPH